MSSKITELLPIPDGTRRPHAYQVFGLEDGEQDRQKIAQAVHATVARLKAAKADSDAQVWNQAARLVQEARSVLADPEKKSELDARFGIISIDAEPEVESSPPDPLAGVLPSSDPLASVLPKSDPMAGVLPNANPLEPARVEEAVPPPPNVQSPSAPAPAAPVVAVDAGPPVDTGTPVVAAAPVVRTQKTRYRKKQGNGMLFFATFAVGMVVLIGIVGYVLLSGNRTVAINRGDGQITISTQPPDTQPAAPSAPAPAAAPTTRPAPPKPDRVMGNLGTGSEPPSSKPSGLLNGIDLEASMSQPVDSSESTPMVQAPPNAMAEAPNLSPVTQPPPAMEVTEPPPPVSPSTTSMADGEQTLQKLRGLVQQAKWKEMKPAAEAAVNMNLAADQANAAESLFQLVDLATYYRGGIERAVAALNVGNELEVKGLRMIIVEKGDDLLTVRYNRINKSFKFDELPFSLAHLLAAQQIDASPTREAAKAAYQAVAPKASNEDRQQSVKWLREINDDVEGADPRRVADTIETLYGDNS